MKLISGLMKLISYLMAFPGLNCKLILWLITWLFFPIIFALYLLFIFPYLIYRRVLSLLFPRLFRIREPKESVNSEKSPKEKEFPTIDDKSIKMPVLRPVLIPTKDQKGWFRKTREHINHTRKWEFVEDWSYWLKTEGHGKVEIVIPKYFKSDGASTPRFLWGVTPPVGVLFLAGLIHDYACQENCLKTRDRQGKIVSFDDSILTKKNITPWQRTEMWDRLFLTVANEVNGLCFFNYVACSLLLSASIFKHILGTNRPLDSSSNPNL